MAADDVPPPVAPNPQTTNSPGVASPATPGAAVAAPTLQAKTGSTGGAPATTSGKPAGPAVVPVPADQLPLQEEEQQEPGIHHGFLQQPWVQDILPLVTSIAFHAAIVIVGLLLYSAYKVTAAASKPLEEQIVIPEAGMANEMSGGVENPGIDGDPTRPAAQDKYEDNTHPDGWAPEPGQSPVAEAAGGGEADSSESLFAAGPNSSFGKGAGFGSGEGDSSGSGSGTGKGRLAPFGAPGGGIPGPRGKVFGNGGNAKTIAFCCDSSGSMIDKFSNLKLELAKAVEGLRVVQQFSIVFFADGKVLSFEGGALVFATPENKRKANKWLDDLTTTGQSDPIPGLEVAFRGKPELMYILTDGDFPNNNEVLKTVEKLNAGKRTRINTIAFTSSATDETSESFEKFLQTLAGQNGGKYKKVSQDQLD